MHSVSRSLLVAGIVALGGLTACGDKVELTQVSPTPVGKDSSVQSVTVSPSTAQIQVNGTQLFVANVIGGANLTNRAVTWSSSNTAVATIDANGVATAKAAGQTSIIATSAANTQVRGVAVLTVASVTPASLSFFGVNNAAGQPATINNAAGQLNIVANVDPGQSGLRTVELIGVGCRTGAAGDTVVIGSAPISGSTGSQTAQQVTIPFVTTAFNSTTGATSYTNGQCQLAIRGRDAAGALIAGTTASGPAVTLNNADIVYGSITTPKTANDAAGLVWNDSTVTVSIFPLIYTRGRTISSATPGTVTLNAGINPTKTLTANATGGFSATYNDATDIGAITQNPLTATYTLVDANGQSFAGAVNTSSSTIANQANGAALVPSSIRYDNQAPAALGAIDMTKFNAQYNPGALNPAQGYFANQTVSSSVTNATNVAAITGVSAADNGGVDRNTVQFAYTTAATPAQSSTWTQFTSFADIPQSGSPTAYALGIRECDALNNCTPWSISGASATSGRFGVDLTAPTFTAAAAPAQGDVATSAAGVTGAGQLTLALSDPAVNGVAGSGFSNTPVLLSMTRIVPSGATGQATQCYNFGTAAWVTPATGLCAATLVSSNYTLPITADGVYNITYSVLDQAGNASAATTTSFEVDGTAPAMSGGVAVPASITTGTQFSSTATDNLDVAAGTGEIAYGATAKLFLAGTATPAGVFDQTLTRSSTITTTVSPLYNSIQTEAQAQTNVAGSQASAINMYAFDLAGNIVAAPATVAPTAAQLPAVTTSNLGAAFSQNVVFASTLGVCNKPSSSTCTNSRTVVITDTVTVSAAPGTTPAPFTQVCFYYTSNGPTTDGAQAGDLVQIGCAGVTATVDPGNGTRKFIYTSAAFDPPTGLGVVSVPITAIGVTAGGNGVISNAATLPLNRA